MMNDQTQMTNWKFALWNFPPVPNDSMKFQNPRPLVPPNAVYGSKPGHLHWKRKKAAGGGYNPTTRRFYPNNKKKFSRFAPYAPRNTTSFIIRSKKSGGIASLVSPCPVTPAILPTPKFSPASEGLVDMAKEEWGVDGYGSMKGLIRLRSANEEEEIDEVSPSGFEGEKRIDHDLSRFEMVRPSSGEDHDHDLDLDLESRVDDQDTHIAKLEVENLTLKDRLFLVEEEMGDLRRRLQILEKGINSNNNENDDDNNNNDSNDDGSYNGDNTETNLNVNGNKIESSTERSNRNTDYEDDG